MSEPAEEPAELAEELGEEHRPIGVADVLCGIGVGLGIIASYVFIGLTPSLLEHHGLILESLAGTNAAIVGDAALARVGNESLILVILAPICTIPLYDMFIWWAGRLWGNRIVGFYAKNNPRTTRWILRTERLVRRSAFWTLTVRFYLPIPNFLILLACGTSGTPLLTFLLGDLLGLLLWEALLVSLGWAIGHPAVHLIKEINHYGLLITIGLFAVIIAVGAIRARRAMRATPEAATTPE